MIIAVVSELLLGLNLGSSTPEEFGNGALRFTVNWKHSENGAFQKRWRHDNQVICLPESSSNTSKMAAEVVIAMRMLTGALERFCRLWCERLSMTLTADGKRQR